MHIDKSSIGLTPDKVAIILNSGANVSLSNSQDDFMRKIYPVQDVRSKVSLLASALRVLIY